MPVTRKIYVLGCGPAGLLAAHAAQLANPYAKIEIATAEILPSRISGAQYINGPIMGITREDSAGEVRFYKEGTREGYATKVYGSPDADCSWDRYDATTYPMHDMRLVYGRLYARFKPMMFECRVDTNVMAQFLDTNAALIISTIPLKYLCYNGKHKFNEQTVRIVDGLPHQVDAGEGNWIVYDGRAEHGWYRVSNINGFKSTEFAGDVIPQMAHRTRTLVKPVSTDCDCWKDRRILLAGRYGKWDKNTLVHDAYRETVRAMLSV